MTVQLSSLRVTAEMDVSSYSRAMAEKVAADKQGAASAKAVGVALGQMDAAAKATGDTAAKLSRQLIDGYSSAAKFEKTIRDVGRAVDTGMSLDRAAIQLDNVYRKFGLAADATVLAQQGFVSIAPVIESLNQHYVEQTRLMEEQTAAAKRLAEATKAQAILEERVKAYVAAVDPATVAQQRFNVAIHEAEDLYTTGLISIEQYRLGVVKAQSALDATAESARRAAAAQAQAAQASFNGMLGVRDTFATTDRGADMETAIRNAEREAVALQKARDEAEAFNRTMLGIRDVFSERDRGADMEAALRDAEAEMRRAAAAAQQAQSEFNALLGVRTDFGGDTRAKDIEAWSRELDAYLANLVRVREAEQQVARERRVSSQQAINSALGVSAPLSDAAYAARASEYEAFGQSIDDLRAKYDPLYEAERKHAKAVADINLLYAAGEYDQERYTEVMRRATSAHDATVKSIKAGTVEVGLNGHQWQNLGFQVNDVFTMLASGSSPFQILATQGGQVIQIMQSGQGGVVGSLKGVGTAALALMTPLNLVIGATAGIGIAAIASYASWVSAQAEVQRSLLGVGRASGATVGQINAIAEAYAAAGKVSESTARQIAASLAGTGQVAPDLYGDAIVSAKGLATVLGVDVPEAAKTLAQALADPARGVETLNQKLGAFDAATLRRVQSLDAQNRLSDAQRIIIDRVRAATEGADKATTGWSRNLEGIGAAISDAWSDIGKWIDDKTGRGPLEDQLKQLEAQREAQEKVLGQIRGSLIYGFRTPEAEAALATLDENIKKVKEQLEQATAKAKEMRDALASLRTMASLDIVMPEINAQRILNDRAALMKALSDDPAAQKAQGVTQDQATQAWKRADEAAKSYLTTQQASTKQLELQNEAITARSPLEKASLAYKQKMAELDGTNTGPEEKKRLAQLAYNNALKEGNYALSEQSRQRLIAADESIAQARLEIQLVGATTEQRELAIANLRTEQELIREAAQNHTAVSQAELAALKAKNAEQAKQNQLLRDAKFLDDAMFERSQLGRTDADQQIASALRAAGKPVDLNSFEADLLRVNAQLKDMRDTASTALSGFASDMLRGVSAAEAFSNQLMNIADKLMKMATDQLVAQAFGGLLGGGAGGGGLLSGLFGGGSTGTVGTTTGAVYVAGSHGGGVPGAGEASFYRLDHPALYANAPRYHTGRDPFGLLAGERRAIINDNEGVFTQEQMRAMGARMTGGVTTSFSPTFNIDASGSNMTSGQIQSVALATVNAWWKAQRGDVVRIIKDARSRRVPGV